MKKSRIAKFALLGASTAALAATLSTSTYAWYVSNKQADVVGGTGTTGAAGSDGSVLVSWTNASDEFYKTINFSDDSDRVTGALAPIHFETDGFYGITDTGTKGTKIASNFPYIQFTVYVKTGTGAPITPSINISATGSNTQIAYVDNNGYMKSTAFDSDKIYYTENAGVYSQATVADATEFAAGTFYEAYTNALPATTGSNHYGKGQSFSVDPLKAIWVQQSYGSSVSYYSPDTTSCGGDAHLFYQAVTGYTPWATTTETSALATITNTANTSVAVTYTIYLDGGDTDCFNSCAGYTLAFDLKFTI